MPVPFLLRVWCFLLDEDFDGAQQGAVFHYFDEVYACLREVDLGILAGGELLTAETYLHA